MDAALRNSVAKRLGNLLIGYGVFLVVAGLVGFELTGETSASSILNGGLFGTFVILLGVLHRQGRMWTHPAALSAAGIFLLTFVWRASIKWHGSATGDASATAIAILLTLMSLVSAAVVVVLFRHYRH